MKITCPENCLELLKQYEEKNSASWGAVTTNEFYSTLEVVPEFARDPKVHSTLLDVLKTEAVGYRFRASKILIQSGDPLGILHLTHNSLIWHPLLKEKQCCSGWTNAYLLPHIDKLTDECIELLIDELRLPLGLWHANILSALPAEKIVPRMRALLKDTGYPAFAAAYVLAMKGNDEGRSILEGLIESGKYIDFALIALSHIPDEQTMRYLRAYADPAHPIYNKQYENKSKAEFLRRGLMLHAQCRLFLLECRDPYPVRRTMAQFYLHSIHELMGNDRIRFSTSRALSEGRDKHELRTWDDWADTASRWINPPSDLDAKFFVINSQVDAWKMLTGISAPDFLCEFATPEDLAYCAEIQRTSIRALLDVIDWPSLGDGSDMGVNHPSFLWGMKVTGTERSVRNLKIYFPGFKLSYEKEDYEHAAVDWVLNPDRYRFNSYWPSLIIQ